MLNLNKFLFEMNAHNNKLNSFHALVKKELDLQNLF
jgi:hypothetical protein